MTPAASTCRTQGKLSSRIIRLASSREGKWLILQVCAKWSTSSDRRWQRTSAEADDVVKPVTHKAETHSATMHLILPSQTSSKQQNPPIAVAPPTAAQASSDKTDNPP